MLLMMWFRKTTRMPAVLLVRRTGLVLFTVLTSAAAGAENGVAAANAAGASARAGNPVAGKRHYALCVACHGANAEGNQGINGPRLAGMEAWYFTRQLNNFKQGVRGTGRGDIYGGQMKPMADALRDVDAVADVAAYVATLNAAPATATVRGDAKRGRSLYAPCAACHGVKAQGMQSLNAPRLAGASDWYLITQLRNFRSGARGSHAGDTFGQQMAPMAKVLADNKAITDVVAYINTLAGVR